MARLSPIRLDSYQPLREVVCESLRSAISKGVLKPGERLMEIQLAEELGVSRTPVREAIRKLELEGYVVMLPRRGTYVSSLTIRDVNEVFEIRTSLESLAAALASERVTDEEMDNLQRFLVQFANDIKSGDMEHIVDTDMKFHDALYQASRNNRLVGIISNLRDQLTRFRTTSMSYPDRLKASLNEHRSLVEAIAQGDAEAAKAAAEFHMEQSEKTLLKAMEKLQGKEMAAEEKTSDAAGSDDTADEA